MFCVVLTVTSVFAKAYDAFAVRKAELARFLAVISAVVSVAAFAVLAANCASTNAEFAVALAALDVALAYGSKLPSIAVLALSKAAFA